MKTITRLICLICCLIGTHPSIANLWVDSIRISPITITKNDSVQIRLYTNLGTNGHQVFPAVVGVLHQQRYRKAPTGIIS
jgi:hypothetical protein